MQVARLRAAIGLIVDVMAQQDVSTVPCECCSRVNYVNLTEARRHEALGAVVTKLNRAIGSIEGETMDP